jgi:multiple sugar transport system permease protein
MRRSAAARVIRGMIAALIVIWSGFPILLLIAASFRPSNTLFDVPPRIFFHPTLENYTALWRDWPDFFHNLQNSFIIAGSATVLTVVLSCAAGWVYSRFRSRFLTSSAFFMIFIRMFPPIVITLPLFPVVNFLHLNDTHIVLILLYSAFYVSLGTWIMKTFIDEIPRELEEACWIDGANALQTIRHVTMPLAAPGAVSVAVFVSVFAWNEFLFAFIFTTSRAKTAPLVISEMLGSVTGVDWGAVFAAATIQLVPALVFVIFVQRFLIAGLSAGGLKG